MIIDCISDLHGFYPSDLGEGDILIIAGDLTGSDSHAEYFKFYSWLHKQKYKQYVFIAGNHDTLLQKGEILTTGLVKTTYLQDSGCEVAGLKVWGCPWTKSFEGMNPSCMAFTEKNEEELFERFSTIPYDVDILITHTPAQSILDNTEDYSSGKINRSGSRALYTWLKYCGRPYLHVFGHIHEGYGQKEEFACRDGKMMKSVNASHVNRMYKPVNKAIRIEL